MTLSPDEAADTLRDIAAVEDRSARAYGYQRGSPYLILWGILWAVGYGLIAAWPQRGNAVWIAIDAIGVAATLAIGFRNHLESTCRPGAAGCSPALPSSPLCSSARPWR